MRERNFPHAYTYIMENQNRVVNILEYCVYVEMYGGVWAVLRSICRRRMTVCGRCATFCDALHKCNLSHSFRSVAVYQWSERVRCCGALRPKRENIWSTSFSGTRSSLLEVELSGKVLKYSAVVAASELFLFKIRQSHIWTFIKIYKSAASHKLAVRLENSFLKNSENRAKCD